MKDSPSKIRMGPHLVVAGGSTSKSGGSTGEAVHAILSSCLTQEQLVRANGGRVRIYIHEKSSNFVL